MRIRLQTLYLVCKGGEDHVVFDQISFFHGEMSAGKSSIASLIDFCFGGKFQRTPALTSELLSVQLKAEIGGYHVLIDRVVTDLHHAHVTWREPGGTANAALVPLDPDKSSPVIGDDIYCLSDLLLSFLGQNVVKVRKRSYDIDSPMIRLSFRDVFKFNYLDQDHLDSDFFLLDVPIRKEKSQDAINFFTGFIS